MDVYAPAMASPRAPIPISRKLAPRVATRDVGFSGTGSRTVPAPFACTRPLGAPSSRPRAAGDAVMRVMEVSSPLASDHELVSPGPDGGAAGVERGQHVDVEARAEEVAVARPEV